MTFISYAQNLEDLILWRALKHIEKGVYIDAGAAWPDIDSVTKAFYLVGWRGINIEPNIELFAQLEERRPEDTNLCVALAETCGKMTMNFLSNAGLSTGDDTIATEHISNGNSNFRRVVEVRSLSNVWGEYIPHGNDVHFLKVDVEGFERSVLAGLDWTTFRPWIVVVESTFPMTQIENHDEWESILIGSDYLFVYADGLNRFYLAKEQVHLQSAFKYPPNIWDNYLPVKQKTIEDEIQKLQSSITEHACNVNRLEEELRLIKSSRSWRWSKAGRVASKLFKNSLKLKLIKK